MYEDLIPTVSAKQIPAEKNQENTESFSPKYRSDNWSQKLKYLTTTRKIKCWRK
jgi:hypothetical protein